MQPTNNCNERALRVLKNFGIELLDLAKQTLAVASHELEGFMNGQGPITPSIAFAISRTTGSSATVWLDHKIERGEPHTPTKQLRTDAWINILTDTAIKDEDKIFAAIALGTLHNRDPERGRALLESGIATSSAQLFRACAEALAHHAPKATLALCETRCESGSMAIKAEAIQTLYGVEPAASLRRAYEVLRDGTDSAELREAALDVVQRYMLTSEDNVRGEGEPREAWGQRVCKNLEQQILTGEGTYHFVQPGVYPDREIARALGAFYGDRDQEVKLKSLVFLRYNSEQLAEMVALTAVSDNDSGVRSLGLKILVFIKSPFAQRYAEQCSADPDPAVAGLAARIKKMKSS